MVSPPSLIPTTPTADPSPRLSAYLYSFLPKFITSSWEPTISTSTEEIPVVSAQSNNVGSFSVAGAENSVLGISVPSGVDDWSVTMAGFPDSYFPRYRMVLPKRSKILVLDLDETLIHSTCRSSGDCDFFVEVLIDRSSCLYYLFKRPHVDHFLKTVAEWYHLVIYTASLREYADPVINWLDGGRNLFKKRLFRSACVEISPGAHAKNLCLVDADLSRVCLLDNTAASFAMHPLNGIPIESWTSDRNDTALMDLLPFFDALRFVDDVRSILSLRSVTL